MPRTWAELLANCDKIKAAGKIAVIGSYKDDWTSQLILLADYFNVQAQDSTFATDYTAHRATFSDTPIALRGFQKLAEIYQRGYMNKDALATTYDQALKMLADGTGAQYPMLTFVFTSIKDYAPDKVNDIGFFGQPRRHRGEERNDGLGARRDLPVQAGLERGCGETVGRFFVSQQGLAAYMEQQRPDGPFAIRGVALPPDVPAAVKDMLPYFDSGQYGPGPGVPLSHQGAKPSADHRRGGQRHRVPGEKGPPSTTRTWRSRRNSSD